jgi:hypothetical protein
MVLNNGTSDFKLSITMTMTAYNGTWGTIGSDTQTWYITCQNGVCTASGSFPQFYRASASAGWTQLSISKIEYEEI